MLEVRNKDEEGWVEIIKEDQWSGEWVFLKVRKDVA